MQRPFALALDLNRRAGPGKGTRLSLSGIG
jgi:hypothetical protein